MLDRASTFADPEIVELLKTKFIPVALDQAYQRRQKDTEGEFYRKIAGQSRRSDFKQTTQGLYGCTANGDLLGYTNNRGADRIRKFMHEWLASHKPEKTPTLAATTTDKRWNPQAPVGGLVIRTRAKILSGYEPTDDKWRQIFNSAVSRDNLWVTAEEHQAIVKQGVLSDTLQRRLARFHLVDNTRGEPSMWGKDEIQSISMKLSGSTLIGEARLKSENGKRTYKTFLRGTVEVTDNKVTRFDVAAKGMFKGEGTYTKHAPKGEFPLAVTFELADGTLTADAIPPQGSRGWIDGYLKQ